MKTTLLRKLRKRYTWTWKPAPTVGNFQFDDRMAGWEILDHRTKQVIKIPDAAQFLIHYVYDKIGLISGANYETRIFRRNKRVEYFKAKQALEIKARAGREGDYLENFTVTEKDDYIVYTSKEKTTIIK